MQLRPGLGALQLTGLLPGRCHRGHLIWRQQPQIGEKREYALSLRSEDLSHEDSYGCGLADPDVAPVDGVPCDLPLGDLLGSGLPPRLGGRTYGG